MILHHDHSQEMILHHSNNSQTILQRIDSQDLRAGIDYKVDMHSKNQSLSSTLKRSFGLNNDSNVQSAKNSSKKEITVPIDSIPSFTPKNPKLETGEFQNPVFNQIDEDYLR
jgi:hypothetical protein